jgi:hypothetical protein
MKNFFRTAKIGKAAHPKKFLTLFVFGGVLCTFRYFHLRFALVAKGIQAVTATEYKSSEREKLDMKKETGRGNPIPAEICPFGLMKLFLRHKVE